jgi:hypothetical protein
MSYDVRVRARPAFRTARSRLINLSNVSTNCSLPGADPYEFLKVTPCKEIGTKPVQLFGHKIEVGSWITVGVENGNGSYAPLHDMMRIARSYNPGNSRDEQNLVEPNAFSQEKLKLCPRNSDQSV